MSAGLAASTVTPGSTAPVVSRTVPAMAPVVDDCADPARGTATPLRRRTTIKTCAVRPLMFLSFPSMQIAGGGENGEEWVGIQFTGGRLRVRTPHRQYRVPGVATSCA